MYFIVILKLKHTFRSKRAKILFVQKIRLTRTSIKVTLVVFLTDLMEFVQLHQ